MTHNIFEKLEIQTKSDKNKSKKMLFDRLIQHCFKSRVNKWEREWLVGWVAGQIGLLCTAYCSQKNRVVVNY
jgi:hypothetical protein